MRLLVKYSEPINGFKFLPRDIRNYIGSIVKDDRLKSKVMWHEHKQPPFIYSIPNRRGFAIYSFLKSEDIEKDFLELKNLILKNNQLFFKDKGVAKIKCVELSEYHYTDFKDGIFERDMRTPLIISSSVSEYARARQLSANNQVDMDELKKMTTEAIIKSISFQNRDWFGKEDFEVEDLMIVYKDLVYTPIKYKEGQYEPAVRGTIVSNKKLPDFLGYKNGLGYGELSSAKSTEKRRVKKEKTWRN